MAYYTKYRFRFESVHGTTYEVRLQEDGFSGTAVVRPLGAAPVFRVQDGDPILSTSCDLVLECQVDEEFVDLYTTDPFQYRVKIYRVYNNYYTELWTGFVATEIYSEPDIAPPYDVRITATDGLGTLKEYDFEAAGNKTLRYHICELLKKTGDVTPYLFSAFELREYQGTTINFLDTVTINLDHLVGKSCYDVLCDILKSLRCVITRRNDGWYIIRSVDTTIDSGGGIYFYKSMNSDASTLPTTQVSVDVGKTVGQMGSAQMWPIGYLTRRVVPAKKSVKVTADWNLRSGASPIEDWGADGDATASGNRPRYLGLLGGTGSIFAQMLLGNFTMDLKVTMKCWRGSVWQNYNGVPYVKVLAKYQSDGGSTKFFHPDTGWTTTSPSTGDEHTIDRTNRHSDPALAQEITVSIPGPSDTYGGILTICVEGHLAAVDDVSVELVTMKGYEDTLLIDNGARGAAEDLSIIGGREISSFLVTPWFVHGVWLNNATPCTAFSDYTYTNKDWLTLTALSYAREHAAPRIEISGKLNHDYDSTLKLPPLFIKSHGAWALVKNLNWNMKEEELDFVAVTLPASSITVDSETITSIPNE